MIIERRGVATGLITTRDFATCWRLAARCGRISTTTRAHAASAGAARVPARGDERMDAAGAVLMPLDEAEVAAAADALAAAGRARRSPSASCTATCNDAHERRPREIVRARLPDVSVRVSRTCCRSSASSSASRPRLLKAYVGPRIDGYLRSLLRQAGGLGLTAGLHGHPRRNGGLMPVETVRALSGAPLPVGPGGRRGRRARRSARGRASRNLITFDVGGTSTDVSLIERRRAGVRLQPRRSPTIRCARRWSTSHVIGAGGGSIAWLDDAGALKVGPRSAGADPGTGRLWQGRHRADADRRQHRAAPARSGSALLGGRMPVDADGRTRDRRAGSPRRSGCRSSRPRSASSASPSPT